MHEHDPEAGRMMAEPGPQGFRWRLAGTPRPPVTLALPLAEAVRGMVYRAAEAAGVWPMPESFHGRPGAGDHSHAYWLPEDADGDGAIDHVVLFAAAGLPPELIPILAGGGEVVLPRDRFPAGTPRGPWRLHADWLGQRAPGAIFGPARGWMAASPFVPPLWASRAPGKPMRNGRDPEAQLRREIHMRGLPEPVAFAWDEWQAGPAGTIPAGAFVVAAKGRVARPDALALFPRLVFPEPVWGPLAFGFGAHFGLGLMLPEDEG